MNIRELFDIRGHSLRRRQAPRTRKAIGFEPLEERTLLAGTPTILSLSASRMGVISGQSETLTATITSLGGGIPGGGTVTFRDGSTILGVGTVNGSGIATYTTSTLAVGQHQFFASYGGFNTYASSASAMVSTSSFIATVAGNGTSGNGGNGGQATAAQLSNPAGVAVDAAGNIYIADSSNNVVRKVTPTGVISIYAGNGTVGSGGDYGRAINAQLDFPTSVAIDSLGDLFIADSNNALIRKVSPSGIITTLAGNRSNGYSGDGGKANLARLYNPRGVAVDSKGDVFIADSSNNVIREVTPNGIITTVAGNGTAGYTGDGGRATSATLNSPLGISVDALGNLFIADTGNNVVRQVNAQGNITTVAGNHIAGYQGDNGKATSAQLNGPQGVITDSFGNLFITDTNNATIRQVTPNGIITTISGLGFARYSGDGAAAYGAAFSNPVQLALNANDDLFIADYGNNAIRKITGGLPVNVEAVPSTSLATSTIISASSTTLLSGQSVTFTATVTATAVNPAMPGAGPLTYVPTSGTVTFKDGATTLGTAALVGSIATFTTTTLAAGAHNITASFGGVTSFSASSSPFTSSSLIATIAGNSIVGYTGDGGKATAAQLNGPGRSVEDAAGNVYFADAQNHVVRKVTPAGIITTIAGNGTNGYSGDGGPATSAKIGLPLGLALDSAGNLYISDQYNSVVRKVSPAGIISTYAGNGSYGYTGDGGNARNAQLADVQALAVDSSGNLFIADGNNNVIRQVKPSGIISTVAGNGSAGYSGDGGPATSATLNYAYGVTVDSKGNLFIADGYNNVIRKVNTSGIITTVAGNGVAGYSGDGLLATFASLNSPSSVAVDAAGDIFISEYNNNVIREVLASGIITTVAGNQGPVPWTQLTNPFGISVDTAGNLFIGDGNNVIRKISAGISVNVASGVIPTTSAVSVSSASYTAGQTVTITTRVTGNAPFAALPGGPTLSYAATGGTVSFYDGTTSLGTATLANGIATLTTTALSAGSHSISVAYAGTTSYGASTSTISPLSLMSTIAGNTFAGATGNGGQATAATLNGPSRLAFDSLGNLYIVDSGNNEIRKVTPAGVISVVAGIGTAGYSGDGALATAAQLNNPQSVFVDASGNIFIADTNNNVVRKINATTGIISTVAGNQALGAGFNGNGGQAIVAQLNGPMGVAADSSGNLYIADTYNSVIRKVSTTGIITTFAGNTTYGYSGNGGPATAAMLAYPRSIAFDGAGNLLIADSDNHVIRKVSTAGVISTVAGNGRAGYSGDGGPAVSATFYYPNAITVDAKGNLFIADYGNNVIRMVTPGGVISTLAGNAAPGDSGDGGAAFAATLNAPTGVAVDAAGNFYIADTIDNVVRKINVGLPLPILPAPPAITLTYTTVAASTNNPIAGQPFTLTASVFAAAPSTTIPNGGVVSFYDGSTLLGTATLSTAGTATFTTSALLAGSHSISAAYTGNGTLFGASASGVMASSVIGAFAGTGNLSLVGDVGPAVSAGLNAPQGILVDASGNVYISDSNHNVVRKITPGGVISTIAGNGSAGYSGNGGLATLAQLNNPQGLALDSAGNLYIADWGNAAIRKVTPAGVISTVAGNGTGGYSGNGGQAVVAQLSGPAGIAVDSSGNLYIADYFNNAIRKVTAAGVISTVAGSSTGSSGYSGDGGAATSALLYNPFGVTVDSTGNLYIADENNYVIRKVSTTGTITTVVSQGAGLYTPTSVTVDSSGNLYIADYNNNAIRKSTPAGVVTTIAGVLGSSGFSGDGAAATAARLNRPVALALDSSGNLYVADTSNNVIRKINTTGVISTIAGLGSSGYSGNGQNAALATFSNPTAEVVDASGNVYVADTNNNVVRKITPAGVITTIAGNGSAGYSGNGGQATAASLFHPSGLALDAAGDLFIADTGNNVVREVTTAGIILTVAGNHTAGFSDDRPAINAMLYAPIGLAVDAAGDLFIADSANNVVRKVAPSGLITTIAGYVGHGAGYSGDGGYASSAQLSNPTGLAIDSRGDLFIADTNNQVIREVSYIGIITTVAGSVGYYYGNGDGGRATSASLYSPIGVSVDAVGDIFIVDIGHSAIREVTPNGLITTIAGNWTSGSSGDTGPSTSASIYGPTAIALDSAGNIYIAANGDNLIRKVSAGLPVLIAPAPPVATPTFTTVAASTNNPVAGQGITFTATVSAAAGTAVPNGGTVTFFDGTTSLGTAMLSAAGTATLTTSTLLAGSHSITAVYGGNGTLFSGSASGVLPTSTIGTYAGTGFIGPVGDRGSALSAGLNTPTRVIVDSSGNLYIAERYNNVVRKVTPAGVISTIAGNGTSGYTGNGGLATFAELNQPIGLALDASGNLYISDWGNAVVRKVTPAGYISTVAGNGTGGYSGNGGLATSAQLNGPVGVAVDASGNLYVADYYNNVVRKVTTAGIISTVAGNSTGGYSGDGAQATSAQLSGPAGVKVDASGNLYITEESNNTVRKVTTAGVISTVVGNGNAGYSGDGGQAKSATLSLAEDVTVDASGNIYVADYYNDVIRRINTSGIISTIAGIAGRAGFSGDGGAATAATLNHPAGISVDSSGNLFVADRDNNVIRKINTSGVISTVAGLGNSGYTGNGASPTAATLNNPRAEVVDAAGNLYFADQSNNVVRKITPAGVITTIAGNGSAGYTGDGGVATSASLNGPQGLVLDSAGNLYIADTGNNVVRKVSSAGIITTVAGDGVAGFKDDRVATNSMLNGPKGLAFDSSGNLYIADYYNNVVRKLTTSGILTTFAGNNSLGVGYSGDGRLSMSAQLSGPVGLAFDAMGDLFIADSNNHVVREVNTNGVISTFAGVNGYYYGNGDGGLATAASLYYPQNIVIDAVGDVFITDQGHNVIREVTPNGIINTIAGNWKGGSTGDGGPSTSAELNTPLAIALDASGNLYIGSAGDGLIRKVSNGLPVSIAPAPPVATPTFTTVSVTTPSVNYGQQTTFTATVGSAAPSTSIPNGGTVTFLDGTTTLGTATLGVNGTATFTTTTPLTAGNHAIFAVYGGNGILFAASTSGAGSLSVINTFAGTGNVGVTGTGPAVAAILNAPQSVVVDSNGNVFFADTNNNVVRKILPTGVILTVAGNGSAGYSGDGGLATSAQLNTPLGIAVDAAGNLYIADIYNFAIRKVSPAGIISTVVGNGTNGYSGDGASATSAQLSYPLFMAFDSAGNMYITDFGNDAVRKVTPSGIISTVAGNGSGGYSGDGGAATSAQLFSPRGIAVDSSGNLYIADSDNNVVRKVTKTTGVISTIAGNGTAGYSGDGGAANGSTLYHPDGLSLDSTGNLYLADIGNNVVRKISTTGIISTVAGTGSSGFSGDGGLATRATLYGVAAVTLDSTGSIFIADNGNNVIRKVNTSGVISTIAGVGSSGLSGNGKAATTATLDRPHAEAFDAAGNLYIVDQVNNVVRKITPAGVITTIAGTGSIGYSGDGGAATSATLNNPQGIAIDAAGNIFIADTGNNVVRKVTAAGVISTVAGDGVAGFTDDRIATNAMLNAPVGLAVDSVGNLYIADQNNNVVRKVSTTGIITTFAGNIAKGSGFSGDGGLALNAQLYHPVGLALDAKGNLFIADSYNEVVRQVNTVGIISTVAGQNGYYYGNGDGGLATSASLYYPQYIAVDSSGDLFIADYNHNAVREVTPNGIISTIAGTWSAATSGNGGPAGSAALNGPVGVAVDAAGNLYISTIGDNFIRKVTTGTPATVIPATTTINGLATSLTSSVYGQQLTFTVTIVANAPSPAIPTGGLVTFKDGSTVLGSAALTNGVATFKTSALSVAGHAITASYAGDGLNFIGSTLTLQPSSIIKTVAGNGTYGYTGDGASATAAQLSIPYGVAVDASGNIYIADTYNNVIRKITTAGVISTIAGNGTAGYTGDGAAATSATFNAPQGVSLDAAGDIFISDTGNNVVREINTAGIVITVAGNSYSGYSGDGGAATAGSLWSPTAAVVDSKGNLYIADSGNNAVRVVTAGIITTFAGGYYGHGYPGYYGDGGPAYQAEMNNPTGVAVDSKGNVYIADSNNNVIRVVTPNGIINTFAGNGTGDYTGDGGKATAATLQHPTGVALDANGNLLIADFVNNVIRQVTPAGLISTVAGNGLQGYLGDGGPAASASLYLPGAVAVDSAGNLLIADLGDGVIRRVTPGLPISVKQDATTTSLAASTPGTLAFGQTITFTATVTVNSPGAGKPTGTVTFKDGATVLGTGTLSTTNGITTATYTAAALSAGAHSITATYGGDTNDLTSVSKTSAVTLGSLPATATYNANTPPVLISPTATYADSASLYINTVLSYSLSAGTSYDNLVVLNQGTGAGQVGNSGSSITYGGTTVATFTGGFGTPLVIVFNTAATQASIQAVTDDVAYANGSATPSGTQNIQILAYDGVGGVSIYTESLTINAAPVVTGISGTTYNANNAPVLLFPTATYSDPGGFYANTSIILSGLFTSSDIFSIQNQGTASGQVGYASGTITYGGTTIGSLTTSGTNSPTILFNAAATQAAIQAVLDNVTYRNSSTSLPSTMLNYYILAIDGPGATFVGVTTSLRINGSPVIAGLATGITYNANTSAIVIDPAATYTDPSKLYANTVLNIGVSSADSTVAIRNQGTAAGQVGLSGGTVTYGGATVATIVGGVGTTMTITFNASATQAAIQAVIDNVTYLNTSTAPTGTRQVTIQAIDAAGATIIPLSQTVTINAAPIFGNVPGSNTYNANTAAILIAPNATYTDPGGFYASTTLVVGESAVDGVLAIRNQGTGAGQVGVSGANVTYGGVTVGTFTGGVGILTISFNATVTQAAIQAVVDNTTYVNTSTSPSGLRQVGFQAINTPGAKNTGLAQDITINAAPVIAGLASGITYNANTPAIVIDPAATYTDPGGFYAGTVLAIGVSSADSTVAIRNQGLAAGQVGISGANVTYGGATVATLTGGAGTTLTITFNTAATQASIQAVFDNVTYVNTSTTPSGTRQFTIQATDGQGARNIAFAQNVAINAAPVIAGLASGITYNANTAAIVIDPSATYTDPGGSYAGSVLAIGVSSADRTVAIRNQGTAAGQVGISGANVTYGGVTVATFTGGVGTTLTITFNGTATKAAIQAVLDNVTYLNTSQTPSGTRQVTIQAIDGQGARNVAISQNVVINAAPIFGNVPANNTYNANTAAILIAPNATYTDPGGFYANTTLIVGENAVDGVLAIRNQGTAAGQVGVSGANVTYGGVTVGTFTGGVGILTINFNATVTQAAIQAVVQNATYVNTSTSPSGLRQVIFQAINTPGAMSQGSPVQYITINAAPVIAGLGTGATYVSTGSPVLVAPAATVTDPNGSYASSILKVAVTNAGSTDVLSIRNQGTALGQVSTSGTTLSYAFAAGAATAIGTFSGGTGTTPLVVTFNASATQAAIQAVIDNLTFSTGVNPTVTTRTVQFNMSDGLGAVAVPVSTSVAVNVPPVITGLPASQNYSASAGTAILIGPASTYMDANSAFANTVLSITNTNGAATDILSIQNQGTGAGQVGVSGTNVTFGGVVVATFTGGSGTTPLNITFNSSATQAAIQAVLDSLTFKNSTTTPGTTPRILQIKATDGNGLSITANETINITT